MWYTREFDLTEENVKGRTILHFGAVDDTRNEHQPRGKQSALYYSHNCDYTRTTGIWQTVWLELVPNEYIRSYKVYPNINEKSVKTDISAVAESGTVVNITT